MSSWGCLFGHGSQTMFLMPCSFIGQWGSLLFIWSRISNRAFEESHDAFALCCLRLGGCPAATRSHPQTIIWIENCWHGTSKHIIFMHEPPPDICKLNPLIWVYVSKWCPFWVPKCPFISKKRHHFETYTHKCLQWRYGHDRCLEASQVSMTWTSWTSDATTSVEMDGASFPQPCVGAGLSSPCKPRNKPYAYSPT